MINTVYFLILETVQDAHPMLVILCKRVMSHKNHPPFQFPVVSERLTGKVYNICLMSRAKCSKCIIGSKPPIEPRHVPYKAKFRGWKQLEHSGFLAFEHAKCPHPQIFTFSSIAVNISTAPTSPSTPTLYFKASQRLLQETCTNGTSTPQRTQD
jgi:hypothetical protein